MPLSLAPYGRNNAAMDDTSEASRQRRAAELRRAEALRANLRRRKEQGRARASLPAAAALPTDAVLDFWFGPPGDPERGQFRKCWFEKNADYDAAIATRFASAVEAALAGAWVDDVAEARGALALLIVLDQFPRNLFRGSARAFAGDQAARALAERAVDAGWDRDLVPVERVFVYLPFEHSEDLADQDRAVALFASLPETPWRANAVDYAERHRDVIRRFGRFPHRNAALGRASTPDERDYLATPGSGF